MKKTLCFRLLSGWLCLGVAALAAGEQVVVDFGQMAMVPSGTSRNEHFALRLRPLPGDDPARSGLEVAWQPESPAAFTLRTETKPPPLPAFTRARLTLHLHVPEAVRIHRFSLRLSDKSGETFQYRHQPPAPLQPGAHSWTFAIDLAKPAYSHWGGDQNGVPDLPLRFQGLVIDLHKDSPSGALLLDRLACEIEEATLQARAWAGNELNLLLGPEETPALLLDNPGEKGIEVRGEAVFHDAFGKHWTRALAATVPPAGSLRLPLADAPPARGTYEVEYRLEAGGKRLADSFRFARMDPAGPMAGPASGDFIFGMVSHPERGDREDIRREALAAGLAGVKILRSDFAWHAIQPRGPDDANFDLYDYITDTFAAQGVEMAPIVDYETPWAVSPDAKPKNPAIANRLRPDYDLYAAYAGLLAKRYRGKIRFFEIWNEPDYTQFANFPPDEYMELLRRAHNAIKAANPDALVMNGGIAVTHTNDSPYIRHNPGLFDALLADGGRHFDYFAFHGHGFLDQYARDLALLKEKGLLGPGKPWRWYSNETGISSAKIPEIEQAGGLVQKILTAMAYGASAYNWYNLREKEKYPIGHPERHYGLITLDFQPKPAYVAYAATAGRFRGAKFLRYQPAPSGVGALLFRHRDGDLLLAHWSERNDGLLSLSGFEGDLTVLDIFGNAETTPAAKLPWMRTGRIPTLLQFRGDPETILLANAPFHFPDFLSLPADGSLRAAFGFLNATASPTRARLRVEPPPGVTAELAEAAADLAPGEARTLTLSLSATDAFRSTLTNPASMPVTFDLGGRTESLAIPICVKPRPGAPLMVLDETSTFVPLAIAAGGSENHYYGGAADLGAEVYLSCRSYFHLRAVVTDNRHNQPETGKRQYLGDGIQFAVKPSGRRGFWKIGLALRGDGQPDTAIWNTPDGFREDALDGKIQASVVRDETARVTTYDLRIPAVSLGIKPEGSIKFTILVNDNDGDIRKGFLAATPGFGVGGDDDAHFIELPARELSASVEEK